MYLNGRFEYRWAVLGEYPEDKLVLDRNSLCAGQEFTAALHNLSMHYVVIVDPGIKVERGYSSYDQGLKDDIFVKDVTGAPYLGQVSLLSLLCC